MIYSAVSTTVGFKWSNRRGKSQEEVRVEEEEEDARRDKG